MIKQLKDVNKESLGRELDDIKDRIGIDKLEQALKFPKFFQIETVRLCNSRCLFCAVDDWDKSVPYMSEELFQKILKELGEYSDWIEMVSIQRAGEPLLDKKIVERVQDLKDAGIKRVSMSTNASLLSEEKAEKLLEAGLDDLMLSIDTIDPEKYTKIRRGLNYDRVVQNIKTLFAVRERLNSNLIIRVRGVTTFDVDSPEGKEELQNWEDFWGRLKRPGDRIYMKQAHNWGNQKEGEFTPSRTDVYHPCVLPWSTLHVTAMGIVPLCPQDYDAKANLGDINQQTIKEVWQNEKWNNIRRLHASGQRNEINFCRGCRLFDLDFSLEKK